MVFSSLTFLFYFFPISLIVYYLTPKKFKNTVLFLSGIVFYMWGEPIYVVVMLSSTLFDYVAGRIMNKYDHSEKIRKAVLLCSIIVNIGLLSYFKYTNFLVSNINDLVNSTIPIREVILPIGISFYTFQSMSYTIDLYKRKIPVQKNFINFGAYVGMYPQLVAGPIVLYDDVRKELEDRKVGIDDFSDGIVIFIRGLAKKVLIANNIAVLWNTIKAMPIESLNVTMAWMGILAFTFQIFFDFSGYSEMAIGLGRMMGFKFPQNFDYPYISRSISEFWRRWHMTLGFWFREYVYIPLGGNRKGLPRTIVNLLIVWGLTGLWHGASWNFVLWGAYFGILIILERLFLGNILKKLSWFSTLYTFVMVVIGWVMFEFESISDIVSYLSAMFGLNGQGFVDNQSIYYLKSYILVFIICIILSTTVIKNISKWFTEKAKLISTVVFPVVSICLFILSIAYLVDATFNPFLYFRF